MNDCPACIKKNKIIVKQEILINKYQICNDSWSKQWHSMLEENCKLKDTLGLLSTCDNEIIKKILLKD